MQDTQRETEPLATNSFVVEEVQQTTVPVVLGNQFDNYKVEAKSRETPAEEVARLKQEGREGLYKILKDGALTAFGILLVGAIVGSCLVIIFTPTFEGKLRDASMSVILLVIGGFMGFLTGKATKGK
jgi:hypothetical protein